MKIIHRYLFIELLPPFVIGLLVLVVLILTQQTLMIMNLLVNKGLSIPTVLRLVLMIFPQFLTMIIPVSVLAASTATFNRFASDGEITALKASGIGLSRLLWPLVLFAFLGYLGSFYMSLKAQETQGMSLQEMISTVLKKKMSLGIRPQVFNNFMDRFVIYVDRMPTFSRMQGVFIYQEAKGKDPSTVIMAREGSLLNEENGRPGIRIQLRSGTLLQGGGRQAVCSLLFLRPDDLRKIRRIEPNASDDPGPRKRDRTLIQTGCFPASRSGRPIQKLHLPFFLPDLRLSRDSFRDLREAVRKTRRICLRHGFRDFLLHPEYSGRPDGRQTADETFCGLPGSGSGSGNRHDLPPGHGVQGNLDLNFPSFPLLAF